MTGRAGPPAPPPPFSPQLHPLSCTQSPLPFPSHAERRRYRTLAAALWLHQPGGPVGAAGQGHERALNPLISESFTSAERRRLLPALITPLLQLLDGARCAAAPAILPGDLVLSRRAAVPPELCAALPTLYAALAAPPPAAAAAGGGQGEEQLRCCERYDFESMREQEEGEVYLRPMTSAYGARAAALALHPQMTAGALAARLLERDGVPLRCSAFFRKQSGGGGSVPMPLHPGVRLGSCVRPEDTLLWLTASTFLPAGRPGDSPGRDGFDPAEQLSCALCQSPQHAQAARDLEAGPRERFLAEMEAAAAVMRAGSAPWRGE